MKKIILFIIILTSAHSFFAQESADNFFKEGIRLYETQQPKLALKAFSKAIKLDPTKENYYYCRGLSYRRIGKISLAKVDFEKAIEINTKLINENPDSSSYYANRFSAYFELKDNENGLQDITKAIEISPKNDIFYGQRGMLHIEMKNYKEALRDFNIAIKLNPLLPNLYYFRGDIKKEIGYMDGACEDWMLSQELGDSSGYSEYIIKTNCLEYKLRNFKLINAKAANIQKNKTAIIENKTDSLTSQYIFYYQNKEQMKSIGEIIFSLPINTCLHNRIKLNITISSIGKIEDIIVSPSAGNEFLDSLIIYNVNSHEGSWIPFHMNDLPSEFKGSFEFRTTKINTSTERVETGKKQVFYQNKSHEFIIYEDKTKTYIDNSSCRNNEISYREGVDAYGKKNYKDAIKHFNQALEYNSKDLESQFNLGICYMKVGNTEKACESFKLAAELGDKEAAIKLKENCVN